MITAEQFEKAVGQKPQQDDLERGNCPRAGSVFHTACGWCAKCDKPRFICGHLDRSKIQST